jgi:hypothetical protein
MKPLISSAKAKVARTLIAAISAVSLGALAAAAQAAAITPGDIVVTQIGTNGSTTALTKNGTASFLDEFPTAGGAMVQQLTLPTTASGSNNPLTIGGTAGSEGGLSLSSNGQFLVVAGYDVGVGGTTQATSTVGLVQVSTGNIDTTTTTTGLSGNNTRSATSTDGSQVWVTGPGGIINLTDGGSGAGTSIAGKINYRDIQVVSAAVSPTGSDQLFGSSQKAPPGLGVSTIGTGTPNTTGQTTALLTGMTATTAPDTYASFFANPTTLFVADADLGLQEWTLSSGTWSEVATLAGSDVGLAGVQNGNTVTLYYTTGTKAAAGWVAGNSLDSDTFTFNSGTTGAGTFNPNPTTLAVSSSGSGFSGVAIIPPTAVPEPFSGSLLMLGGFGLLMRRSNRRA